MQLVLNNGIVTHCTILRQPHQDVHFTQSYNGIPHSCIKQRGLGPLPFVWVGLEGLSEQVIKRDTTFAQSSWDTHPWNPNTMLWGSPAAGSPSVDVLATATAEVPVVTDIPALDIGGKLANDPGPRPSSIPRDTKWSRDKLSPPSLVQIANSWAKQILSLL